MKNLITFEPTLNETKFIKGVPIISNTSNQRLETHEQLRYEFADYVNGSPGREQSEPSSTARE